MPRSGVGMEKKPTVDALQVKSSRGSEGGKNMFWGGRIGITM